MIVRGSARIVARPQFHGHRARYRLSDPAVNPHDGIRLFEEIPAPSTVKHFGGRTGKVQVDDVVAGLFKRFGRRRHGGWIVAENLCPDGMLIVVRPEGGFPQELAMSGAFGQHDAGKRQRRAEIEGQSPHGIVAVTAQRGLYERDA